MLAPDLGPLRWVKSSYSTNNGVCVEIATLPTGWRTSSHSTNNGTCVEIAHAPAHVAVRDSKNPTGPALVFPTPAFTHFLH